VFEDEFCDVVRPSARRADCGQSGGQKAQLPPSAEGFFRLILAGAQNRAPQKATTSAIDASPFS
jgi:hypothetical protein